jgi:hypothetical protein
MNVCVCVCVCTRRCVRVYVCTECWVWSSHSVSCLQADERIDVVDVCPTLSPYFAGVDIPADSVGISRAYLGRWS